MQNLTISFIQDLLIWHDPKTNRAQFSERMSELPETDLIVLPEMFTTGFSFTSDAKVLAEASRGVTVDWMKQMSQKYQAVVTGSLIIEEGGEYYNRLVWMRPDGSSEHYDKRHLFRMAGEHQHFSEGTQRLVVELNGWHICPLICYDLRFPTWSRNTEGFYLLIYVASWPAIRRAHWQTLLSARAIENQCYVVGVNRIGKDDNEINYCGDSCAINALGETLIDAQDGVGGFTCTLNHLELQQYREQFPAFLDADRFKIDGI